jgi:hypothetical protein
VFQDGEWSGLFWKDLLIVYVPALDRVPQSAIRLPSGDRPLAFRIHRSDEDDMD